MKTDKCAKERFFQSCATGDLESIKTDLFYKVSPFARDKVTFCDYLDSFKLLVYYSIVVTFPCFIYKQLVLSCPITIIVFHILISMLYILLLLFMFNGLLHTCVLKPLSNLNDF